MYLFISLLYMFRATQCSSSGELVISIIISISIISIIINIISSSDYLINGKSA